MSYPPSQYNFKRRISLKRVFTAYGFLLLAKRGASFSLTTSTKDAHRRTPAARTLTRTAAPPSPLASVNHDSEDDPPADPPITITFPPLPEDLLVLAGDVSALALYSYVDHYTNSLFASAYSAELQRAAVAGALPPAPLSGEGAAAAVAAAGVSLPYAPVLSQPGPAAVVFASVWICAGYCTEAFTFGNTVSCAADRSLLTTVQAWSLSAVLMTWIAVSNDVTWGADRNIVGGLTGADGGESLVFFWVSKATGA